MNFNVKNVLNDCIASQTLDENKARTYFSTDYTHTVGEDVMCLEEFMEYLHKIKKKISVKELHLLHYAEDGNIIASHQLLKAVTTKSKKITCEAMTFYILNEDRMIRSTFEVLKFLDGQDEYIKAKK